MPFFCFNLSGNDRGIPLKSLCATALEGIENRRHCVWINAQSPVVEWLDLLAGADWTVSRVLALPSNISTNINNISKQQK